MGTGPKLDILVRTIPLIVVVMSEIGSSSIGDIIDGEITIPTNPNQKWYKRVIIKDGVSDPRKIELLGTMIKSMVAHGKRDRSVRKKAFGILKNFGSHVDEETHSHPFIMEGGELRHPVQEDQGKALRLSKSMKHSHKKVIKGVAPHDYYGEMRALQKWVQENIRYTFDPSQVEYFQTPRRTLLDGVGDCDDQSILVASMLESVGYDSSVCLTNPRGQGTPYSHAIPAVKFPKQQTVSLGNSKVTFQPGKWYLLETTQRKPFGWRPPKSTMWTYIKIK